MASGIYQIRNKKNGKVYIGSAVDIERRWRVHKRLLKQNKHHSRHLQRSYNKHGECNFIFEVLEGVEDKNLLLESEQRWMDKTRCCDDKIGYNICPTAGSNLGKKATGEQKKARSERTTGEKNPMFGKGHLVSGENNGMFGKTGEKCPMFGKTHSLKTKKKISEANLGKKLSPETKKKLSEAFTGEKNPNFGRTGEKGLRCQTNLAKSQ